jgi:arsenate reductase
MAATIEHVLIICTGNACRSQMAEGFFRYFGGDALIVYTAGLEAHGLNPTAVKVMAEAGVPIDQQTSQSLGDLPPVDFDTIITVCDHAQEHCPYIPGDARRLHAGFPDPAKAEGSETEILQEFRQVRDKIRDFARDYCQKYTKSENH